MLKLKNADAIAQMWNSMTQGHYLLGVLIRHAEKPADGNARCGLSPRGEEQARVYGQVVSDALTRMLDNGAELVSSKTKRNIATLQLMCDQLSGGGWGVTIETPAELDLPFLGEHDEDLATCRALAAELNAKLEPGQPPYTPNSLFARLEEFGKVRVGETPAVSEARIRKWMFGSTTEANDVFIYSMNSPVGNRAAKVGVDEALAELEVVFLGDDSMGGICLLGRIAPEWEEVAD